MATNLEKLRGLLQELFQLDQADLDFGIYRIMNQKRDEVVRFLDKDLLPQVQSAFKQYKSADKSVLQKELDEKIAHYSADGIDPDSVPKVKELRKQIAESAVDVTALENEVFSHLFNFFRRYYSEGDFISLRRYKEGVYAIPYEGEEVKLHWANADQYYVKSSETFRDYTFVVAEGKRVRVHLVAASTEQDNNKAVQGKERRFVLAEKPLSEENGELFIRFEYRPHDGKEKQDDLNKQAIDAVLKTSGFEQWGQELGKLAPTDKRRDRTVLEKHLTQYTARNTFDYFIHKDLGKFLRQELDFYIKNEVMYLDDIEHESAPKVEQYLSQIKVIRSIAHKIIQFLEQLENFQKKLWLKRKFVIETNYCITLDRIPESLYPKIAENEAQLEEWVRLFAIDEIKKDLNGPGYSKPPTVAFLKAYPHLVVDTRHFSPQFTERVLKSIDDLDKNLSGLVIDSENLSALNLLQPKYLIRAQYMQQFKEYLEDEGLPSNEDRIEFILPVIKNLDGKKLTSIRLKEGVDFKRQCKQKPTLDEPNSHLLKHPVTLNWYPKIQSQQSKGVGPTSDTAVMEVGVFGDKHLAFMDLDAIYFELQHFKNERSWYNLNLPRESIMKLLQNPRWYRLFIPSAEMEFTRFDRVRRWEEIAVALLKKYIDRYYKHKKQEWEADYLEYHELREDDPNFVQEYRLLIDESAENIKVGLEVLKDQINKKTFKAKCEIGNLSAYWFGNHLYQPLLHLSKSNLIEVSPVSLNDGERDFVLDLKKFHDEEADFFKDRELFLLRNVSKRGIGFFEAGNFYPDFILWLLVGKKQYVTFVDPKGLLHMDGGSSNPKVQFYQTIKEIESRLADPSVILNSFIVSPTPYQNIPMWGDGMKKAKLQECHVLFQKDDKETYIKTLLTKVVADA